MIWHPALACGLQAHISTSLLGLLCEGGSPFTSIKQQTHSRDTPTDKEQLLSQLSHRA